MEERHTVAREIEFLRDFRGPMRLRLGREPTYIEATEFYERYLRSMSLRKDWGTISATGVAEIREEAKRLLEEC